MLIIIILLGLLNYSLQDPPYFPISGEFDKVCHTYQCGISPKKLNDDVTGCMFKDEDTIYLKQCEQDWYCSGDQSDSDCKTTYCALNLCKTKGLDASCTSSLECGSEMLCSSTKKCTQWILEDQPCSDNPELCYPGSRCIKVNTTNKICVKFFSQRSTSLQFLDSTTTTTNSSTDYIFFQDIFFNRDSLSVYCASGFYNPSTDACSSGDPLTSKQGFPYQCTTYSDCISDEFSNIYSPCDCTYSTTLGYKHCVGFHGDNKLKSHFNQMKSTMQKSFKDCKYWEVVWGKKDCGIWEEKWDFQGVDASEIAQCNSIVGSGRWDWQENAEGSCPKISCASQNEEGLCLQYDDANHIFYLSQCKDGYYCGYESDINDTYVFGILDEQLTDKYGIYGKNVSCAKPSYGKRAKGESCWVDNDCYSGKCSNTQKICEASQLYGKCTANEQCDKGLICDFTYNQCLAWISPYKNCSKANSSLCRPGSLCITYDKNFVTDSTETEANGECLPYYSIPANLPYYIITSTYVYTGELDFMCDQGAFNKKLGVCNLTPRKSEELPKKCEIDSVCDSQIGGDGVCVCFPNNSGHQYCKGFEADYQSDIFDVLRTYYQKELGNCLYYQIGTVNGEFGECSLNLKIPNIYQFSVPSEIVDWCTEDVLYSAYYYQQSLLEAKRLFGILILMLFILVF